MRKISFRGVIVLLATLFFSISCFAALISPVDQLQSEANRMISQLKANQSQLSNLNVVRKIVNSVLLPNVDLNRMSASVVGDAWRTATPAQKAQFQKEFSYLVTTTYAAALASYNDDQVRFQPLRDGFAGRQTMRLNSIIIRKNGQRISVNYDVVRAGDRWRVYDFSIENISMVQSYRAQFADVLAKGGMPALLQRLQTHNRSGK